MPISVTLFPEKKVFELNIWTTGSLLLYVHLCYIYCEAPVPGAY